GAGRVFHDKYITSSGRHTEVPVRQGHQATYFQQSTLWGTYAHYFKIILLFGGFLGNSRKIKTHYHQCSEQYHPYIIISKSIHRFQILSIKKEAYKPGIP